MPTHSFLLTTKDYAVLETSLRASATRGEQIAFLIQKKLSNADVIGTEEIDPYTVTLNSRVVFRVDGGPDDTRIVINGDENGVVGMTIPIHVPRGLALLGARAGQDIVAMRRDGSVENIRVEEVAFQPEAYRRDPSMNGRPLRLKAELNGHDEVESPRRGGTRPSLSVVRVVNQI